MYYDLRDKYVPRKYKNTMYFIIKLCFTGIGQANRAGLEKALMGENLE